MITDGFYNLDDIIDSVEQAAVAAGTTVFHDKVQVWLITSIDEILHFHVRDIWHYVFSNADKRAILRMAREKKYEF